MTIKDVCKMTGITEDALKYYEKEGLISPKREKHGKRQYRVYGEQDIERIKHILCFRQLNMKISEIQKYFNLDDSHKISAVQEQLNMFRKEREHIDNMISTLEYMQFANLKYIPLDKQFSADLFGSYIKEAIHLIDSSFLYECAKNLDDCFVNNILSLFEEIAAIGIVDESDAKLQKCISEIEGCINEKAHCGLLVLFGIMKYSELPLYEKNSAYDHLMKNIDHETFKNGVIYYCKNLAEELFGSILDEAYEQYQNKEDIKISDKDFQRITYFWNERVGIIPISCLLKILDEEPAAILSDESKDEDVADIFLVVDGVVNSFKKLFSEVNNG